ncbi:MAG: hypothetical protein WCX79_03360 [Candidatus Paceibacterota bacterium]|jgi:hypothetical protein
MEKLIQTFAKINVNQKTISFFKDVYEVIPFENDNERNEWLSMWDGVIKELLEKHTPDKVKTFIENYASFLDSQILENKDMMEKTKEELISFMENNKVQEK